MCCLTVVFFFNDTATTEIYTLSLHDALPICVYLGTGTIGRVDTAFVEAAAGFSTTNITTLDPGDLSVSMQLWRAATQWVGGLFGILVAAIALPLVLRGTVLNRSYSQDDAERLAPTPVMGRRRIMAIYSGFTLVFGLAYSLVGLGARDSVVHALTTKIGRASCRERV